MVQRYRFLSWTFLFKRSQGEKATLDLLKASLNTFDIKYDSWEQEALDRSQWYSFIFNGSKAYESNHKSSAKQMRLARKKSVMNAANDAGNIPCMNCNKTFNAQIGLFSKLRTQSPLRMMKSGHYRKQWRAYTCMSFIQMWNL